MRDVLKFKLNQLIFNVSLHKMYIIFCLNFGLYMMLIATRYNMRKASRVSKHMSSSATQHCYMILDVRTTKIEKEIKLVTNEIYFHQK